MATLMFMSRHGQNITNCRFGAGLEPLGSEAKSNVLNGSYVLKLG